MSMSDDPQLPGLAGVLESIVNSVSSFRHMSEDQARNELYTRAWKSYGELLKVASLYGAPSTSAAKETAPGVDELRKFAEITSGPHVLFNMHDLPDAFTIMKRLWNQGKAARHIQMQALVLGSIATHSLDQIMGLAETANAYVGEHGAEGVDGIYLSLLSLTNVIAGLNTEAIANGPIGAKLGAERRGALMDLVARAQQLWTQAVPNLQGYISSAFPGLTSLVDQPGAGMPDLDQFPKIPASIDGIPMSIMMMEFALRGLSDAKNGPSLLANLLGVDNIASQLPPSAGGAVVSGFHADSMSRLYDQAWALWFKPKTDPTPPPKFNTQEFLMHAETVKQTGCEKTITIGAVGMYKTVIASTGVYGTAADVGLMAYSDIKEKDGIQGMFDTVVTVIGVAKDQLVEKGFEKIGKESIPILNWASAAQTISADGAIIAGNGKPVFTPSVVWEGSKWLASEVCTWFSLGSEKPKDAGTSSSQGASTQTGSEPLVEGGPEIKEPSPIVEGPQLPPGDPDNGKKTPPDDLQGGQQTTGPETEPDDSENGKQPRTDDPQGGQQATEPETEPEDHTQEDEHKIESETEPEDEFNAPLDTYTYGPDHDPNDPPSPVLCAMPVPPDEDWTRDNEQWRKEVLIMEFWNRMGVVDPMQPDSEVGIVVVPPLKPPAVVDPPPDDGSWPKQGPIKPPPDPVVDPPPPDPASLGSISLGGLTSTGPQFGVGTGGDRLEPHVSKIRSESHRKMLDELAEDEPK